MITSKNIDEALKKRYFEKIKEFFKKNNSMEERIGYLRELYGNSGWGIPGYGDFINHCQYGWSGIEFTKGSERLKINWNKIVTRVEKIIENESQISLF